MIIWWNKFQMEIRQIRSFLKLAEHLNFSRAAKNLHIVQSALSMQIKHLEEEIGTKLFERNRRRVRLTDAGKVFLEDSSHTLAGLDRAVQNARRAAKGEIGRLRVGFVFTGAVVVLPKILIPFRQAFRGVELELRNMTTREQLIGLQDGKLDAGFLRLPVPQGQLTIECIHREPFALFLSTEHPLASAQRLRLIDLANSPFVMYARHQAPGFHDRIMRILNGAGIHPEITQEASEMQTILSLVAAGIGVAILPASVSSIQLEGVLMKRLPGGLPQSEIGFAAPTKDRTSVLEAFAAAVGQTFKPYRTRLNKSS
jgi:DNA-binding transcriptional LysR family regulator